MRFLDLALGSLSCQLDTGARVAGTDGYAVHFEPYALAELYQTDRRYLNRLYLHMVFHCLFRHLTRRGEQKIGLLESGLRHCHGIGDRWSE